MDLFVLIIIIVFVFIIKYLIDTINSLNGEIREIKDKCIGESKNSGKDIKFTKNTQKPYENINNDIVKNIMYFKDYFDNKSIYTLEDLK
jgi:predicted PurR-regulated permease PerM